MGKRFCSKLALFASLLLVFQLVFPMLNAFAATDPEGTPPLGGQTDVVTTPEPDPATSTVDNTTPATEPTPAGPAPATTTTTPQITTLSSGMLPPSNLAFQLTTPDTVKLTWSSVFGATGYNVYGIIDGQLQVLATTTATSYTFPALKEGEYQYVMTTLGAEGESGPCAPVSVTVTYPKMAAPDSLTYKLVNGNDIALTWTASQYATSYNLYQVNADGTNTLVTTVSGKTTYTFANAAAGSYTYAVSAVNTLYGESPVSATTKIDLGEQSQAAPGSLTSKVQNGNDIVLSWSASQYATAYNVYQVIGGQKVLQKTQTATTLTLTNMPAGDYVYVVTAFSDRFGESADSTQASFTLVPPVMTAPENFKFTLANINDINLSWTAVSSATGYKIYQVTDGQKTLVKTVTGTSTSFTNQASGDYTYEIHSYSDRFGESTAGSLVSLTVATPTMTAPSDFTYKINNGNDIALSWTAAPNANSYKIYLVNGDQKVLKATTSAVAYTFTNAAAGTYTYEIHSVSTRYGESAEGSQVNLELILPLMAAPQEVVQAITSATGFTLNWDAVPYANSYKVYQVTNGTKVLKSNVTGTSVAYSNMTPGDYTYEVHSFSSRFGESADGATLTFTLNGQTMPAPTNLTYTLANGNDITLKWTAAQYATSYKVYQVVDGQNVLVKTQTATALTLTNQPGGDYHFLVTAVSTTLGESPEGAETTFTLVLPTLASPANLTSKIQNGNDIVLTWAAAQYANSYKIYEVVNGEEVLLKTATSLTTTISKVTSGDHIYSVHTVSTRFGESATGSQITVSLDSTTMQPPTGLTQTTANGNDITLKWTAATYATAYNIYLIQDGQPVLQKTVTGTSYTFTNLPGGDYIYEVHSYSDRFGESMEGSQVAFNLTFPTMQAPANFTQSYVNGNDVVLRWNASTYATSYNVYQVSGGTKTLAKTLTGVTVTFANQPEGDYTYEVHSVSTRFGESPEGSTVDFKLVFPTMQAPGTLTNTITNGNDITLRWGTATYATAYKVYQVLNGEEVLQKTQTGSSLVLTNMPAGDYSYAVHSYSDRFGESPVASTVNFKLVWPVVAPPTLTASVVNANNVTLTWPSVQWANEYRVYQVNKDGSKTLLNKGTTLSYQIFNLAQDTFSYEVTAFSTRFGESQASNRQTVTIVYPVMQAPVVTAKVLSTSSATLSWGFITYANGYNIYELVNGQPVLVKQNLNALSYTLTNLPYANHQYYVTSYSNSFGESVPSNTVLAKLINDTVAPVTTANAPTNWTNQTPVVVTLSATDNDTGVAKTYVSLNDAAFAEGTSVTVNQEGTNKVSFYSVDKVNNIETTKTVFVKIDKTAPVTSATAPTGWSKDGATVTLTATDAGSGVAKTFYSINGGAYAEGTTVTVNQEGTSNVSYYSIDNTGNAEQAKTVTVKLDQTAPTTTATAPTDWSKDDVTVALTATDAQSGVAKTYYSVNGSDFVEGTSITLTQEGVNAVSFYSVDNAGNKETAHSFEVKLDRTAPTTTATAPTDWSKDDVTVALTATDAQSGVAKTYYSVNGSDFVEGTSVALTQEGVNTITFYSVDVTGNTEKSQTLQVKLDKAAPTTTADAPTNWSNADVTVNFTATDAQSGVANTYYSVNGSDFAAGTSVTLSNEGTNVVSFYSVDNAGNVEKSQTVTIKLDKSAPTTTSDAATAWSNQDVTVHLTASDAQSGVAKTYYSINGGPSVEGTSFTLTKEGENTVTFYSVDQLGNAEKSQTITVKLDKTAPVTAASNVPTDWTQDDVTVNFTATDAASGVANTYYSINGAPYTAGNSVTVTQDGTITVSYYTVDTAGNQEAPKSLQVKIDHTPPTVTFNLNDEYAIGSFINLRNIVTFNDLQSNIVSKKVNIDGPFGIRTFEIHDNLFVLLPGEYKVTVTATDASGQSINATKSFTAYIPVTVEVTPSVIKGNKGEFTVRTGLPSGFLTQGFDLNTITLNGVKALTSNNGYYQQAKNGQFKFERSNFNWSPGTQTLELRGYNNGFLIVGKATVKVQK